MQSSARLTESQILALRSSGDVGGDPKPADFEESVARYAAQWGKASAAKYRARMEASFKISRALKRGQVATLAWQAALAHANGFTGLFARLWSDLLRTVRGNESVALGCVNCWRAAAVHDAKTDTYRELEHADVELTLAAGRTHTVEAVMGEWSDAAMLSVSEHPLALRLA